MEIVINCGKGLESICETEWRKKEINQIYSVYPEYGRIKIQFEGPMTPDQLIQIRNSLLKIRCFEKIYLFLNETESNIPRRSLNESHIRAHLEESFSIISEKSFPPMIECLSFSKKTVSTQIQFQSPDINPQLTQKQILAVIQKIAKRFGRTTEFNQDNLAFSIWIGSNSIRTLLDLEYPPGNLSQLELHPTGLFPSFAYGLIQSAIAQWVALNPNVTNEPIQIIDPMMGAGIIPLLLLKEAEDTTSIITKQNLHCKIWGIEKEMAFFEKANNNLKRAIKTEQISLFQQDFQSIQGLQPFDMIITQPPYGMSIPMSDQELSQLYHDLFSWTAKYSHQRSILAIITPREAIINKIEIESGWKRIETLPVKEHTLHCNYFIFMRLEPQKEVNLEEKAPKAQKRTKAKKKSTNI